MLAFEELQQKLTDYERKAIAYEVIAELFPNLPKELPND